MCQSPQKSLHDGLCLIGLQFAGSLHVVGVTLSRSLSCAPSRYSRMTQMELSVSQTPSNFMMLRWLSLRINLISFSRESLPFSPANCFSLEKAFTATILWSRSRSARQTVANAPLPIFRLALNSLWKLRWLMRFSSYSAHASTIPLLPPTVTLSLHPSRSNRKPNATPIYSPVLPLYTTSNLAAKLSDKKCEGRCVGEDARRRKLSVRVSWTSAALRRKVFLSLGRSSSWARWSMQLLISSKSVSCIGRFGDNILNDSCMEELSTSAVTKITTCTHTLPSPLLQTTIQKPFWKKYGRAWPYWMVNDVDVKDQICTFERTIVITTPLFRFYGGWLTMNCSLALMLLSYLEMNRQRSSMPMRLGLSSFTRFSTILFKISEYLWLYIHLSRLTANSQGTQRGFLQSQLFWRSSSSPAPMTVAPIEKTSDLRLSLLSIAFSDSRIKSQGAKSRGSPYRFLALVKAVV